MEEESIFAIDVKKVLNQYFSLASWQIFVAASEVYKKQLMYSNEEIEMLKEQVEVLGNQFIGTVFGKNAVLTDNSFIEKVLDIIDWFNSP